MNEKSENKANELLRMRSTLTENLLFGTLRKDTFDEIFTRLEIVYLENEMLREFIKSKNLESEFQQFSELGSSD